MSNPTSKNLSEALFKPVLHTQETSSLIRYLSSSNEQLEINQNNYSSAWYRALRKTQWIWQGVPALEIEEVLARIASTSNQTQHPHWLDTVAGYRPGNWSYEWSVQGMRHQKRAGELQGNQASDEHFIASLCFSLASYPHLKGDSLSLQAQTLANKAYMDAVDSSPYIIKQLEIPYKNKKITANLHLPHTDKPLPVVIVSAGSDSLQTDMWRLFRDFLSQHQIGMLTLDMPGVGSNAHWNLTEDSSVLHQAVLNGLVNVPWVDHYQVGLLGFRLGGNVMTRLAFLEQEKIKACVTLGAPIHEFLANPQQFAQMPKMFIDVHASRMGKSSVDIASLSKQIRSWSLKSQGVLSSRQTLVPIMAIGLSGDPVGSKGDNQSVAMFSRGGKAIEIKSKSLHQGYDQALNSAVDWLKSHLIE